MERLSIRVRLAFAYIITFGILLGLLSVGLYRIATARLYAQADAQIKEGAAAVRPLFNVSNSQVAWLVDRKVMNQSPSLVAYAIFDEQGSYLDGSNLANVYNLGFTKTAGRVLQTRSPAWETITLQNQHKLRVLTSAITGSDGRVYLLRAGMLLDRAEDDLHQIASSLATLVPLILVMGGMVGWWLADDALRPVAEITATARRISASNLAERLPLRGTRDELDRLSTTLNEMISRLQNSFEQMSHFLSNVSHELRTPLAGLRGSCEIALRNAKSADECRAVLANNIEQLDRLANTVSDLLEMAHAEAGQMVLKRKRENITELVRDAVESIRPLATEQAISIHYHADDEILADVDPEHFLRSFVNLLDNSIKYNNPNGRVEINLKAGGDRIMVSVADTGRGIAPEDLPHIFERFYRGHTEGGRSDSGTGLGLSLARWVAAAHGGHIEVESQLGYGSTFRIWLPKDGKKPIGPGEPVFQAEPASRIPNPPGERRRAPFYEGRPTMHQQIVRWSYRLGIACGVIAFLWRGLIAVGVPGYVQYGAQEVSYRGFLNAAILFLLVAAATAGYLLVAHRE